MQCRKCGYNLKKGWLACPVCSDPINKKPLFPFVMIGIVILSFIVIPNIFNYFAINNITEERRTKRYLESKYNEKFNEITLVHSTKNPDTDLSCDGASCGTIKGKGETEYYLVYSKKDDIEFIANYNTHTKEYNDTYELSLNLREYIGLLYDKVKDTFSNIDKQIFFSANIHDKDNLPYLINSAQELTIILSRVTDGYPEKHTGFTYTRLYMDVNINGLEFCKNEYDNILMIDNYLRELESNSELYSRIGFSIHSLDDILIEFNRLDSVRIYDEFATGKAWGETIEEFIQMHH